VRMIIWFAATIGMLAAIFVSITKWKGGQENAGSRNTMHIVLIGASIGQAWELAEWPSRVRVSDVTAESVPAWQFDKTQVVDEVLMRPARKFHPTRTYLKSLFQPPPRKPDVVILKECSSYFPGDLVAYQNKIQNWVTKLQAKHINVVLATVVPVTQSRDQQSPGKQQSLVQYNEWVRQYAEQHGLGLLDLEAALRTDASTRYLRDEFAASDGSHLNAAAYRVLDNTLRAALSEKPIDTQAQSPAVTVGR
jgi:GDSL-like Lipase/Acylhydrolase family